MEASLLCYVIGGVAWTIVYLAAVIIGVREKTYCIPIPAVALNITWETLNAAYYVPQTSGLKGVIQSTIILSWLALDFAICWTFLRFGSNEIRGARGSDLVKLLILLVVSAAILDCSFIAEFGWAPSMRYAAFLVNIIMSALFVQMFYARRGPQGKSLVIAVCKAIGSWCLIINYGLISGTRFVAVAGIAIVLWDSLYIALLCRMRGTTHVRRPHDDLTPTT